MRRANMHALRTVKLAGMAAALWAAVCQAAGVTGGRVDVPLDDAAYARMGKAVRHEAFASNRVFRIADLAAAMNRREPLGLVPAAPAQTPLDEAELHARAARATFALYTLSEEDYKTGNHARLGAAFLIHPGVAATCFHAFKGVGEPFVAAGLTVEGRPVSVVNILALYPLEDLALLQVEGAGDTVLPLRLDAPAGVRVRAIGHPLNKYFFAVEGMVARYGLKSGPGGERLTRLHLMIHSIGGFSGGALVDTSGNAVGMLDSFETLKAGEATYDVHSAIPAATIRARFTEPYACGMTPEAVAALLRPVAVPSATVEVHTIKTEGPKGAAIAEVRSDAPRAYTVRIEDKGGNELARGRPSDALRAGLPEWAKPLYDENVKTAEAKAAAIAPPAGEAER
ncbi:MAG TPA: serine protease [Kiritimatiellia bacterium]|nr:serine protease [Kiritimatiellia bacterium]HPO37324.1 serine protease [Kiritimatiellia bacterium]HQA39378.1 serine protease [Kiritimatiellia bacterium]HQL50586.1 serine protease [Kiritimatiellia bacterium]HQQ91546.1 serine protease [Kiritimatiellia bacterium]